MAYEIKTLLNITVTPQTPPATSRLPMHPTYWSTLKMCMGLGSHGSYGIPTGIGMMMIMSREWGMRVATVNKSIGMGTELWEWE